MNELPKVGSVQDGREPYLAYVIQPGSELCDLETVNKLVDAESQAAKYEAELTKCAEILQRVHPMGSVMGIGLLCVAQALQDVVDGASESHEELAQPFTVDWLCEIGGVKGRLAGQEVIQFHSKSYGAFSIDTWNFGYWKGESVPGKITTRGDVLKWLDVLGIVPASTKGDE